MAKESNGMGLVGVLTILFVVLKLVKVIYWSWWWVLSPVWISFGLWLIGMIVMIVGSILFLNKYK